MFHAERGAEDRPKDPDRTRRRWWLVAAASFLVSAVAVGVVLVVQHRQDAIMSADVLTARGSYGGTWWESPSDAALEEKTGIGDFDDEPTRAVPLRKGEIQGVAFLVTNQSEYPATVHGSQAPELYTVQISTTPMQGVLPHDQVEFADSATIGPGEVRYLLVRSTLRSSCAGYSTGSALALSEAGVKVEVEGTERTVRVSARDQMLLLSMEDENPPACPPITR
ncbi:hypothetical protein D1871_19985 [Nakamurella silvestris]|nr:hypothetical protein D1871_19985 [Nakamurella silvestris]